MWLDGCPHCLFADHLRSAGLRLRIARARGETLAIRPVPCRSSICACRARSKPCSPKYPPETLRPGDVLVTNDPWLPQAPGKVIFNPAIVEVGDETRIGIGHPYHCDLTVADAVSGAGDQDLFALHASPARHINESAIGACPQRGTVGIKPLSAGQALPRKLDFEVKGEVCGCDLVALDAGSPTAVVIGEIKLTFTLDGACRRSTVRRPAMKSGWRSVLRGEAAAVNATPA